MRKKGQLHTWSPLQYGFVIIGKEIFFLHGTAVVSGLENASVGAWVEFDVSEPMAGKRYPRAVNATVTVGGAA